MFEVLGILKTVILEPGWLWYLSTLIIEISFMSYAYWFKGDYHATNMVFRI